MRASRPRSHHSSSVASGVNRPRMAKPSVCSATRAAAISAGSTPRERASAASVTGPRPSRRPRTISTRASSRDQVLLANAAGGLILGSGALSGQSAANCGTRSAAIQIAPPGRDHPARPPLPGQVLQPILPAGLPRRLVLGDEAEPHQGVVQLVGVGRPPARPPPARGRWPPHRGGRGPMPLPDRASAGSSRPGCAAPPAGASSRNA